MYLYLCSLYVSNPIKMASLVSSVKPSQHLDLLACAGSIILTSETGNLRAQPNLCPPGSSAPHCLSSILFSSDQVTQDWVSRFNGQGDIQRDNECQASFPLSKSDSLEVTLPPPLALGREQPFSKNTALLQKASDCTLSSWALGEGKRGDVSNRWSSQF